MSQPPRKRREHSMQPLLDLDPGRAIAIEVRLVHRQGYLRQVDLTHQADHSRHFARSRLPAELTLCDEAAELVTAEPRDPPTHLAIGVQYANPASDPAACRIHGDGPSIEGADRLRCDAC